MDRIKFSYPVFHSEYGTLVNVIVTRGKKLENGWQYDYNAAFTVGNGDTAIPDYEMIDGVMYEIMRLYRADA